MAGSVTVKSPEDMSPREYMGLALRTERTPDFVVEQAPSSTLTSARMLARLLHGAIGLCTEAGELQDAIKKNLIYGIMIDRVNIIEEIGDLMWYCALVLDSQGSTFEDAMERNIAKLKVRFPDKFSFEAANVRDLDAERKALEGDDRAALRAAVKTQCSFRFGSMNGNGPFCSLVVGHDGPHATTAARSETT